ncbi:hypothetical protein [Atrimonas thermophila]|uniref:hypothetical protein n=1 Tax=Atrimonas thermophila TaxID=3064161 RepID=UPI00399CCF0D
MPFPFCTQEATSSLAKNFLKELLGYSPFPVKVIQVDGEVSFMVNLKKSAKRR